MGRRNARLLIVPGLLLAALFLSRRPPATADRPVERRTEADYVIVGRVDAVYERDGGTYANYIVELKVESVEKGPGLKPGDTFRAYCYQRQPGKGDPFDDLGHDAVPKEGQRITAYVRRADGRHEGVYPHWFDPAPAGKK